MNKTTKLELTWIGKESRPLLEPRILLEDASKSYHAHAKITDDDLFDNRVIFGDNLLALKALEQEFGNKINCIFIDPPFNSGNAFEHYDDGLEHSVWLSLMRDRLEILRRLLAPDGFFCCHIDDSEGHYLKVLLDEVFGRANYLTSMYIQVRYGNKTLAEDNDYQKVIEQCLVYARDAALCRPLKASEEYKVEKFEWEVREKTPWKQVEVAGKKVEVFRLGEYEVTKVKPHLKALKETWATGSLIKQKASSGEFLAKYLSPRKEEDGLGCLYKVYGIGEDGIGYRYFTGPKRAAATKGKFYSGIPLDRLAELLNGRSSKEKPIENFYDLAANFGNCRHEGGVDFRSGKKPETYMEIILKHFSRPGDIVLDSFAGSGTTGAVAHKMRRRWIMVELRDHCHTLIIPRLQRIIDGIDESGITGEVGWLGGGGFRYFRLASSLLEKDKFGNWVISKRYNAAMLAEAMCKFEGFTYAPSGADYWNHGFSTERDFIYVTTQTLTREQLQKLSDEVGENRSLLVCCSAFRVRDVSQFPNMTIKKIPKMVLNRCEWGRDDYSLEVKNLPQAVEPELVPSLQTNGRKKRNNDSMELFATAAEKGDKGK
ncbi:MAG TPA: site-specific DNA-methyltransferase [Candidatus Acidoferrales bacterium]|nr:site-specific DNA-methyltransferase [Candidatus Acidoferrales bacterium]